jgi:hypothetical protein
MANSITQQLDACTTKLRERACPGCHLGDVFVDIDGAVDQLRWEFEDVIDVA